MHTANPQSPKSALISIVIVNYKVPEYLRETIRSVYQAEYSDSTEIIVVDNASGDRSKEAIMSEFPAVQWIQLKLNIGFGKACNVGAQKAGGKYLLLLNPDTMIAKDTLKTAFTFMESHPEVGLMGPKILNPDGTLQASCKRGFPTPSNTIYHFMGLSRLFPKSKRFGGYNLTYIEADTSTEVDAVSGSFMFMPRDLFLKIGGFDERFFMYGEDLDLCYRIKESGKLIWYYPGTQIIHRKGKSSEKSFFRSRIAFYEAMILFSRKYRNVHQGFFPGWLVFIGILTLSAINISVNIIRQFHAVIVDLLIINFILFAAIILRFPSGESPYHTAGILYMLPVHSLFSLCFLFMFVYNGIYKKRQVSFAKSFFSAFLAASIFSAAVYFIKQFAFSRISFAFSSVIIPFFLAGWREVAHHSRTWLSHLVSQKDEIIIVGTGPVTDRIITGIEQQRSGRIAGIVWDNDTSRPGDYQGYPVLGSLDDLISLIPRYRVDTLIIATNQPWYSQIINLLSVVKIKNLTIRWVPHELTLLPADKLPAEIPLKDFSV